MLPAILAVLLPAPAPAPPPLQRPAEQEERGSDPFAPPPDPAALEPPPPTPAEVGSARLERVEEELLDALVRARPSAALDRGLDPPQLRPWSFDSKAALAWSGALERASDLLASTPWHDLAPERALDRAALQALVATELLVAERLQPDRRDPGWHLVEHDRLLRAIARDGRLGPDARLALATRHLAALPAGLEPALEATVFPRVGACGLARLRAGELGAFVARGPLDDALAEPPPSPHLWRPFEAAQRAATEALGELGRRLDACAGADHGRPRPLGEADWTRLVAAATGATVDADALRRSLLRALARLELELREGPAPPASLEALAPPRVRADVEGAIDAARAALAGGGATFGADPGPVRVRVRLASHASAPLAATRVRGDDDRLALELELVPHGTRWPPGVNAARLARLGPGGRRALALRHGAPGEASWIGWALASPRLAQRALWSRPLREGWGLYAADAATRLADTGSPLADPDLRRAVLADRRREAGALLAALELHARGGAEDRVVETLVELARMEPDEAREVARLARLDPLLGTGYVAYEELVVLEGRARAVLEDDERAVARVAELVSASPSAPASALAPRAADPAPRVEPEPAPEVEVQPSEGR